MLTNFREKLGRQEALLGTLVTLPSPCVAEMLSATGFDWLWIDMEHAPLSLEQVQALLQAKRDSCAGLVRVPYNDEVWIKRVLDLGADGIIVPQVKTARCAERAVAAAKYPPHGIRSAGIGRAHLYGINFSDYIKEADEKLSVLLQIEHVDGVKNIDAILQVGGVDGILIGPYDLSGSFGKLGAVNDDQVRCAIDAIKKACQKHKLPCGIFALDVEAAQTYLEQGFSLLALGIDAHYLWNAAKKNLSTLREKATSLAPH